MKILYICETSYDMPDFAVVPTQIERAQTLLDELQPAIVIAAQRSALKALTLDFRGISSNAALILYKPNLKDFVGTYYNHCAATIIAEPDPELLRLQSALNYPTLILTHYPETELQQRVKYILQNYSPSLFST